MKVAAALGGLLLVTQIVLLAIQLHVLRASNGHIRSQDAKATRLYPLQRKSSEIALPLLRDARGVIKPLGKQTGKIVQATDVLPNLASEAIPALRGVRLLIGAIFSGDLIRNVARTAADVHQSLDYQRQSVDYQRQSVDYQQRSLAIQQRTVALQKQALAILRQSRGIQAETLTHARNLDNKTGGGLTAP